MLWFFRPEFETDGGAERSGLPAALPDSRVRIDSPRSIYRYVVHSGVVGPIGRAPAVRAAGPTTPENGKLIRTRDGHGDVDSMDGETDASGTPEESSGPERGASGFDGRLLSDLAVNVIPIGIIVALTGVMVAFSPGGAGESVLLFHGALIGGVVVVSVVAGWAVGRVGSPLEGSAGRRYDTESDE